MPSPPYHKMPKKRTPIPFPRILTRKTKKKRRKRGLILFLPAISPKCSFIPINHTCILTKETGLPRQGQHIWLPHQKKPFKNQSTCMQFDDFKSVPPRGYKGNAPTDLRPKGVSSRRHTNVTQVLYTAGRPARPVLPTRTRNHEETKKKHSP